MNEQSAYLAISREAMACEFEIRIPAGVYPNATGAALAALNEADAIEERFSYFSEESELTELNKIATEISFPVAEDLYELLSFAKQINGQTDGAFDVTGTPLWELWGFARRDASVPSNEQIKEALEAVGSDKMVLTPPDEVELLHPAAKVSLGSLGKGHALDLVAASLERAGIESFLIHAGGSSVTAMGNSFDLKEGWEVGIGHPTREGRLESVTLSNASLATSGGKNQFFIHRGKRLCHILNPRTGHPAMGCLSVTVRAPTARQADALATAFFVLGPEKTLAFLETSDEDLAVLMVLPDESIIRQGW